MLKSQCLLKLGSKIQGEKTPHTGHEAAIMEMEDQHARQIQAIKNSLKCERNFECEKSGFAKPGKVVLLAGTDLLQCLREEAKTCRFAMPFGEVYFCRCPLRTYLAKHSLNR